MRRHPSTAQRENMSGMQDKKINVLQIVGNARLGGVASCLLNCYRRAGRERFRFDFVTYAPSDFDGEVLALDPDAKIYYISPFQKNFLRSISELEDICCGNDYSIVHSHLTALSDYSLAAAAHAKVPVRICHAHSALCKNSRHRLPENSASPFAAEHATHLMACSMRAAESAFGKRADEAVILPDAIEAEHFYSDDASYAAARTELGLSGKIVLFVGRFAIRNNIPFLIEAFAKASADENMTLVLVGDGEQRHAVREAATKLGVTERVRIVPPTDPAPWFKAADVFCMPTRHGEPGVAAIEAQAAGLKCIFSDAVPKETNITGNCIFLTDDPAAWAAELRKPATHAYDCSDNIVAARYDIAHEAHRLTDAYLKFLG